MISKQKNTMSGVKQAVITAVCIALCTTLPLAFHSIPQAGIIYCPMHIPVIICGLVCSWQYGLSCGVIGTTLSAMITGMPTLASYPQMVIELAIYGVCCSLLMRFIHTKRLYADLYISLVISMLAGRLVAGGVNALIFARGETTFYSFFTAYFVTCLPGIIIQLAFIPSIYVALEKAGLINSRYVIEDENDDEED